MSADHDAREAKEEDRAPAPESPLPVPVRVGRVRREMAGVTTLELTPASAFGFVPGQFNMLYMFGLGEVAIRPKITGSCTRCERSAPSVRRSPGSAAMTSLACADLTAPYWPVLDSEGSDVVIVAGGLGLAPLRPVIYRVLAHRERSGSHGGNGVRAGDHDAVYD